jgi:hypothetical protein
MPSQWPGIARTVAAVFMVWRSHWRRSPGRTSETLLRVMRSRVRAFLGLRGA